MGLLDDDLNVADRVDHATCPHFFRGDGRIGAGELHGDGAAGIHGSHVDLDSAGICSGLAVGVFATK